MTDLLGGLGILARINGVIRNGTLGLVMQSESGTTVFVTAGHVVGNPEDEVDLAEDGSAIGTVLSNPFNDDGDVDAATVLIDSEISSEMCAIAGTFGDFTVSSLGDPAVGDTVTMQGAESGIVTGTVTSVDATVNGPNGQQLTDVVLAGYASQAGDSGAPVFETDDDGNVQLVGFHGGSVLIAGNRMAWFEKISNVQAALGVQSCAG